MAEQQQGTEYTLQGVMRFLQIEWHNHERARNGWDIERAEMKAKIAKQEGDNRSAKKLNESLTKQIRMLERALKHERAKNKAIAAGEEPPTEEEVKKEWNGKIGIKSASPNGAAKTQATDSSEQDFDDSNKSRDIYRDKSKQFLQKCVEELTYLLTPPAHPPPPQTDTSSQGDYPNAQDLPPAVLQAYYQQTQHQVAQQQQHAQQQQKRSLSQASHLPALPNHYPPPPARPMPEYQPDGQQQAGPWPGRSLPGPPLPPPTAAEPIVQEGVSQYQETDDAVEKVQHSYDAQGRPTQQTTHERDTARSGLNDDNEPWNFDDSNTLVESVPEIGRQPETDAFPSATSIPAKSPPKAEVGHRRRSSGSSGMARRRSSESNDIASSKPDSTQFKVRFALRGHLDVVRSVIFTGGGSPSEPEICTTGDDGTIKRWYIPASYGYGNNQRPPDDLDVQSYFTHRGHEGTVTSLAACPAFPSFSTGGRTSGDGWIFSGGQDASIRVWERGRVDPKATLIGHKDTVWTVCVLPANSASIFGQDAANVAGGGDRILIATGSADHTIKIWAVSAPPQLSSPQNAPSGNRRGVGGSRRHSVTSGSNFPSSPQPSIASDTPFHYSLVHSIEWPRGAAASPTCISPLGPLGETFVVSYNDSSIIIFDTRTGDEVVGMASGETYDGSPATGINSVVVTSTMESSGGTNNLSLDTVRNAEEEGTVHGATGSTKDGGVEGVIISGHEDKFVRFFDANSGQCTYSMLAHPSSIASLSLSPDGRELVSAGHDASLRFWSLEKRSCTQEITSHRLMRGEGVCSVVWSQDGRFVVSGGGDGTVKVFAR